MLKHTVFDIMRDTILILEAGSQYGKLIDRCLRQVGVHTVLMPFDMTQDQLQPWMSRLSGIVVSGSPQSVNQIGKINTKTCLFELNLPILGICYGMQWLCQYFNTKVHTHIIRQDGQFNVELDTTSPLFSKLASSEQTVLLTHGDSVLNVDEKTWKVIGTCHENQPIVVAVQHCSMPVYGVQFHPEVQLTPNGIQIFENFCFDICHIETRITLANRLDMALNDIRNRVSIQQRVLVLVSGGVDSSVCALLCQRALGNTSCHFIHIDNGLLRKDETKMVKQSFDDLGIDLMVLDCHEQFLNAQTMLMDVKTGVDVLSEPLCNVTDPQIKRHIIGDTFVRIVEETLIRLKIEPSNTFIVQGTLRPDLIESASHLASHHAQVIKTHHNDTRLVRAWRSQNRVLEPLADFHKDEVRALAMSLGLPRYMIDRQPFPGPGLAIRMLCTNDDHLDRQYANINFCETKKQLQALYLHIQTDITKSDYQSCATRYSLSYSDTKYLYSFVHDHGGRFLLAPIQSVGVQGDARSYQYVCILQLSKSTPSHHMNHHDVNTNNNLTINHAFSSTETLLGYTSTQCVPWNLLRQVAIILPKLFHHINRVVYSIDKSEPPKMLRTFEMHLDQKHLDLLREIDHIVNTQLFLNNNNNGVQHVISQAPVILLPLTFDDSQSNVTPSSANIFKPTIVLHPVMTLDFMTAQVVIPGEQLSFETLDKLIVEIHQKKSIDAILYDLTSKPPGTIEWE